MKVSDEPHPIHLTTEAAHDLGLYYDESAAQMAVVFFGRYLQHSTGRWAGKPFKLQPWQEHEIIRPLFGWKRAEDGSRRFKNGGIWIPKKNGKSTLASGLALLMLTSDREAGAEVYSAAADRAQAGIIFRECANMVRSSPRLKSSLVVTTSTKTISYPEKLSRFQALSADVPTKEGLNIHCLIFDELHNQKKRDLWDTLIYGGAARHQPLTLSISTAGVYRPESIGWEQWAYAKSVLNGTIDDPFFFAFIAAAADEDDWLDPKVWARANPSMGVTIRESDMAEEAARAVASPAKQATFKRYRLNMWTQAVEGWLDPKAWADCSIDPVAAEDTFSGRICHGGLDLSSTVDITAFALVFQNDDGGFSSIVRYWMPAETLQRAKERDNVPYDLWVEKGYIKTTPGSAVDYAFVRRQILEDSERFNIVDIGFDPWNASETAQRLTDEGLDLYVVRQGFQSLSEPMKKLEALVVSGKFDHRSDPVLRWMADNVALRSDDNNNIAYTKSRSIGRIDGISAVVMALARSMAAGESRETVYSGRGIRFF